MVTKSGNTDTDVGIDVDGLPDGEPKSEFAMFEYETVECLAHARKNRCFAEVAYVVDSVRQPDLVSRSCG